MERGAKGVAHDLKDMAVMGLDGRAQDGVVPRPQGFPRIATLARKFGAALDVREEEGDGAGGVCHALAHLQLWNGSSSLYGVPGCCVSQPFARAERAPVVLAAY
jgi:hypothetical protein